MLLLHPTSAVNTPRTGSQLKRFLWGLLRVWTITNSTNKRLKSVVAHSFGSALLRNQQRWDGDVTSHIRRSSQ